MRHATKVLIVPVAALLLSACAQDQGLYPSLGRRPGERANAAPPLAAATPGALPADPALLARIEGLVAAARAADALFQSRGGQARALVAAAAGAPMASEAWAQATTALSALEAARSEAMIALADLDTLYARAEVDGTAAADLGDARAAVLALVEAEDRVLAELHGRLAE